MNLGKRKPAIKDTHIVIILSIITFVACALWIPTRAGPLELADETSYLAIAAFFAGYDWSYVISAGSFYSHGYSLLLVPFFILFNNPDTVYTFSLILNVLLVSSLVPLSYALCKRWGLISLKADWIFIPAILFTVLSGTAIAYSALALAETTLVVTSFATTLCFYKLQENGCKHYWFAIQALLLAYGFAVHQRFLGVLVAGALVILVMMLVKRIEYKKAITFFCTLAVLLIIGEIIKAYLQAGLWSVTVYTPPLRNDFRAVTTHAARIVTEDYHLLSAVRVFVGQMFYLGVASFMLIFFAIHKLGKQNIRFIANIREQKKDFDFAQMFMILAFFATFAISVVFMHRPTRGDQLIYGRYNSMMYSILCLFILAKIIKGRYKFSKSTFVITAIFIGIILWTGYNFHNYFSHMSFADVTTLNMIVYRRLTEGSTFIIAAGFVSILIGLSIILFRSIRKLGIARTLTTIALVVSISISNINAAIYITTLNRDRTIFLEHSAEIISQISNPDLPVYFMSTQSRRSNIGVEHHLQYRLFDRTLFISSGFDSINHDEFYIIQNAQELFIPRGYYKISNAAYINSTDWFRLHRVIADSDPVAASSPVKAIHMTNEYSLRIDAQNVLEHSHVWTGAETSFLFTFDPDADHLFRVNLAWQLIEEIGSLNFQFKLNHEDEVIYSHVADSSTAYIEFIVPKEKLTGMHHVLTIIGDTWETAEVLGEGNRTLGMPIASVEAIPINETGS